MAILRGRVGASAPINEERLPIVCSHLFAAILRHCAERCGHHMVKGRCGHQCPSKSFWRGALRHCLCGQNTPPGIQRQSKQQFLEQFHVMARIVWGLHVDGIQLDVIRAFLLAVRICPAATCAARHRVCRRRGSKGIRSSVMAISAARNG